MCLRSLVRYVIPIPAIYGWKKLDLRSFLRLHFDNWWGFLVKPYDYFESLDCFTPKHCILHGCGASQ